VSADDGCVVEKGEDLAIFWISFQELQIIAKISIFSFRSFGESGMELVSMFFWKLLQFPREIL